MDGQQGVDCLSSTSTQSSTTSSIRYPPSSEILLSVKGSGAVVRSSDFRKVSSRDTCLVGRFEQPRPQVPVNLDHRSDHLLGASPEPPSLLTSLFHFSLSTNAHRTCSHGAAHVIDIRAR